jgi:hypothetical protein
MVTSPGGVVGLYSPMKEACRASPTWSRSSGAHDGVGTRTGATPERPSDGMGVKLLESLNDKKGAQMSSLPSAAVLNTDFAAKMLCSGD